MGVSSVSSEIGGGSCCFSIQANLVGLFNFFFIRIMSSIEAGFLAEAQPGMVKNALDLLVRWSCASFINVCSSKLEKMSFS